VVVSTALPSVSVAASPLRSKLARFNKRLIQLLKTPGTKVLGVFLYAFSALLWADCGFPQGDWIRVITVIDGDTLKLEGGRRLRVLGINAPELAHGGSSSEALGPEAKRAAEAFIAAAGRRVRIAVEAQAQDKYGRLLAHVYGARGQSLGAALVRQGLAFAIAVAPNVAQAECLFEVEHQARNNHLGVWASRAWRPLSSSAISMEDTGFKRVYGRVEKVVIDQSVLLELDGRLVIKVARADLARFARKNSAWRQLKGRKIEVVGWVARRSGRGSRRKPLQMRISAPQSLRPWSDN